MTSTHTMPFEWEIDNYLSSYRTVLVGQFLSYFLSVIKYKISPLLSLFLFSPMLTSEKDSLAFVVVVSLY